MTGPDTSPTVQSVTEAECIAAHNRVVEDTGITLGSHVARAALEAAAQVRAGHDGEVGRLTRDWDFAVMALGERNHELDEAECDRDAALARATQAKETVERMREALRPIVSAVRVAGLWPDRAPADMANALQGLAWRDKDGEVRTVTWGDLRRIAALADPATDAAGAGAVPIAKLMEEKP